MVSTKNLLMPQVIVHVETGFGAASDLASASIITEIETLLAETKKMAVGDRSTDLFCL